MKFDAGVGDWVEVVDMKLTSLAVMSIAGSAVVVGRGASEVTFVVDTGVVSIDWPVLVERMVSIFEDDDVSVVIASEEGSKSIS